jgi:hypothetical protein
MRLAFKIQFSYGKKKQWKPSIKKEKRGMYHTCMSSRNMKTCQNIGTALLQSTAKIGTPSTMKTSKNTLHEFSPHILQKPSKENISTSTNEMLHADELL